MPVTGQEPEQLAEAAPVPLTARIWSMLLPETAPQRALAVSSFVNAVGSGMFMAGSALYFTRIVGLPMSQVAFGLFAGAMTGLAAGVLVGRMADRWGARETQIIVMAAGAVAMSCYMFVTSVVPYVMVSVLLGVVFAADKASKAPLIRAVGGENPAQFRAYLRSLVNLAIALGSLAAGIALQLDSRAAYLCLIGGRVVAFIGGGIAMTRLPRLAGAAAADLRRSWDALRDRPYLTATALNGIMSLHFAIPAFVLPLWIVSHTVAPRWTISALLAINTIMIITLQVVVSRNVDTPAIAGQRMRWAGIALFVSMALMALTGGLSAVLATALLLVAMVIYTLAELWHAAASMEYSFGLALPEKQGQYSGVFGLGVGVAEALAPILLGAAVIYGWPAWLLIATGFLVVGTIARPLISWTQSRWRLSPT